MLSKITYENGDELLDQFSTVDFIAIYNYQHKSISIISDKSHIVEYENLNIYCDFFINSFIEEGFQETCIKIGDNDLIFKLLDTDSLLILAGGSMKVSLVISQMNKLDFSPIKNESTEDTLMSFQAIQRSILSDPKILSEFFNQYFIYNSPLKTIGGDYYWFGEFNDKLIFIVADCNGHGAEGSMSALSLDTIIKAADHQSKKKPEKLIQYIYKSLSEQNECANKSIGYYGIRAQLGIGFLSHKASEFEYISSGISFIHSSENHINYIKTNKKIGYKDEYSVQSFTRINLQLNKGDKLFFFTDGFEDSYAILNAKKLGRKGTIDLIQKIDSQFNQEKIQALFDENINKELAVDDVLLLGMEV